MSIAVVFPGQGSQRPGAGAAWADHPSWEVVTRAELALDQPLASLLLDASAADLGTTRSAQLSVLLASLVAWDGVRAVLPEPPAAWAGHSLGQVTALLASGTVDHVGGLRFAAARADATQRAADERPGRMVALLGASEKQAAEACAATDGCWIANVNAPGQVVLAGTSDGVDAAARRAAAIGVRRVRPLDVGGAFHTPLMAPAADALIPVLEAMTFHPTAAPVVTNHDAEPHGDGRGWPERLTTHLVAPVRWADGVTTMVGLGVDTFVEVGPGGALAGLMRRIAPEAHVLNVADPADLDGVAQLADRSNRAARDTVGADR